MFPSPLPLPFGYTTPPGPQVDSDDLPLNVSRETLQQHKLLKVIKKKLVRKALDMFKKMEADDYKKFWEQYGTSIKLGLIEDAPNKARLSQLLRFHSSNHASDLTSLEEYVGRMKEKQEHVYFMAASSKTEVCGGGGGHEKKRFWSNCAPSPYCVSLVL